MGFQAVRKKSEKVLWQEMSGNVLFHSGSLVKIEKVWKKDIKSLKIFYCICKMLGFDHRISGIMTYFCVRTKYTKGLFKFEKKKKKIQTFLARLFYIALTIL